MPVYATKNAHKINTFVRETIRVRLSNLILIYLDIVTPVTTAHKIAILLFTF